MERKHKLYEIYTQRTKFKLDNKSAGCLKRKLITKRGNKCEKCGKERLNSGLQFDHIIPIHIGGHPYNENNLQLLCNVCHGKKSGMERHLFRMLRELRFDFASGGQDIVTPFTPKQVRGFYCYLKKIYEQNEELYNNFKGWDEEIYHIEYYHPYEEQ
jgi:hypothetical protein